MRSFKFEMECKRKRVKNVDTCKNKISQLKKRPFN